MEIADFFRGGAMKEDGHAMDYAAGVICHACARGRDGRIG
jgi:hypothetical protein